VFDEVAEGREINLPTGLARRRYLVRIQRLPSLLEGTVDPENVQKPART
jgi:hypothetical protein